MEFQKIVEELLEEDLHKGDGKKKGIIAANFTTKTGLYASAQTGTSAGVLAPQFSTASSEGSKSFAQANNASAEDDTTTTKKTNATKRDSHKNSSKNYRAGTKHGKGTSRESKGTIIKYKPVDFGGVWKWS